MTTFPDSPDLFRDATWTELDERTVDTIRVLAADAVQKVGNGHPGTAMSLAPAAYLLFQHFLAHDPADPITGPRSTQEVVLWRKLDLQTRRPFR